MLSPDRQANIDKAVKALYDYIDSLPPGKREKALEYQAELVRKAGKSAGGKTTGATDMTTKQPEALRLADDLDSTIPQCETWHVSSELRRQHAEIETLRTGYEAARLEIESLRASHGQAPAQPKPATQDAERKHLTDEQIERDRPMMAEPAAYAAGVRYAEKHHGIAEQIIEVNYY